MNAAACSTSGIVRSMILRSSPYRATRAFPRYGLLGAGVWAMARLRALLKAERPAAGSSRARRTVLGERYADWMGVSRRPFGLILKRAFTTREVAGMKGKRHTRSKLGGQRWTRNFAARSRRATQSRGGGERIQTRANLFSVCL
jgi:hypothetical protein